MKRTPLYELHQQAAARLVEFAGYEMPLHYPEGIIQEHLHTRNKVALFDISHMGQIEISGRRVQEELEQLLPLDLDRLSLSHMAYTVLLNEQGGILDDVIITRRNRDNFVLVVNAACKDKVIRHLGKHLEESPVHVLDDHALLALQGPQALNTLLQVFPSEIASLRFMEGMLVKFQQIECFISRSGYTGEDGFEISVPATYVEVLAKKILTFKDVKWAGLGARDSLRLEAGLCLYGHELTENISPIESGLAWTLSESRREGGEKYGGFLGERFILDQIKSGVGKKRVGLRVEGKIPVRADSILQNQDGVIIGTVTSGTFSPSLNCPIAMGYVDTKYSQAGTMLTANVRGKRIELQVTPLPFIPPCHVR